MPEQQQDAVFGNCEQFLREMLAQTPRVRRLFIVAGRNSFQLSGLQAKLQDLLSAYQVEIFSDFSPNPQLNQALNGAVRCSAHGPDMVLAVGGGSAIDIGKLIAVLAGHNISDINAARRLVQEQLVDGDKVLPLVAIPTTAGSGSEATHFAVCYIDKVKYSLAHPAIRPQRAIIDFTATQDLPLSLTASAGFDALCQAIESFWSCGATEESQVFASQAIELLWPALPRVISAPDADSRAAMALGAYFAGAAIDISKTTLPHALSYEITMRHGVAHGHAVALSLPRIFAITSDRLSSDTVIDPRGAEHVRARLDQLCTLLGITNPRGLLEPWERLMVQGGLEIRLSALGCRMPDDLEVIAKSANPERLRNHPLKFNVEDFRSVFLV